MSSSFNVFCPCRISFVTEIFDYCIKNVLSFQGFCGLFGMVIDEASIPNWDDVSEFQFQTGSIKSDQPIH